MDRIQQAVSRRVPVVAAVALCLVIVGCASGSASAPNGGQGGGENAPRAAASAPAVDNGTGGGPGGNGAPAEGKPVAGGGNTSDPAAFGDIVRIVYTGTMRLRVEDLDAAVRAGREAVLAAGGYIAASRQSVDDTTETASVTYRIPVDRWEETVELLRGLGDEIGEEISSDEVSAQVVDLEARIRNLRVHEAAVQRHAEQAGTFEEILEGQDRLAAVRDEIERLEAQLANLENQADLGTLTVTYGTEAQAVARAAEAVAVAWDGQGEVARATATLVGMLQSLASFGIWFGIVWLPAIALLLLLVALIRAVLRRSGVLDRLAAEPAGPHLPGA